ncbi:MtN3/saliva family protein [Toxoplasma gondii GAB2-2007-GAL-DOM2]|uniref:Sugar transporter SWEET1 n=5 Tax=Toxoplasma gondii TaxID=5811 RepID=B9Q2S2_TOXGV|nr:MtN3/saliva family protein [Toxoplasma gondii GT1]ESS28431.1 MtN3/saliva family protein [Toxoplasma gondii VEG]KAF4638104.1 MtN3/saliva family protein [Toxoplasma gondii]KFG28820.1 MtN3/saliva family protein [Toxoplasma gondii p89]KFG47959.1 MtN3/saliva family protein [Toxoplasma gondii GAB2-2007-GAL-DOM2]
MSLANGAPRGRRRGVPLLFLFALLSLSLFNSSLWPVAPRAALLAVHATQLRSRSSSASEGDRSPASPPPAGAPAPSDAVLPVISPTSPDSSAFSASPPSPPLSPPSVASPSPSVVEGGETRQAVVSAERPASLPSSVLPMPLNTAGLSPSSPSSPLPSSSFPLSPSPSPSLPLSSSLPSAAAAAAPVAEGAGGEDAPLFPREQQVTFWSILVSPLTAFPAFLASRLLWLMKVLAVLSAVVMLLSPLPTIIRIKACRSTAELQGLPYVMLLLSAIIWLVYGVLRRDIVLLAPNLCGFFLSLWYVQVFRKFCKHPQQAQLLRVYVLLSGLLLLGIFLTSLFLGFDGATKLVGLAAAVINVFSYVAPLSALRVILREKSTACLPVEVSVGNWICSSLWLFYGWLSEDLFILLPNLIGTIVGCAQLALLAMYPPPSRRGFSVLGGSSCSRPYRPPACSAPAVDEAFSPSVLSPSYGSSSHVRSSFSPLSASSPHCLSPSASFASGGAGSVASTAASLEEQRLARSSGTPDKPAFIPENASVCANAPSLPTHEMLLRDWQQRLLRAKEEEREGWQPPGEREEGAFLESDEQGNPCFSRPSPVRSTGLEKVEEMAGGFDFCGGAGDSWKKQRSPEGGQVRQVAYATLEEAENAVSAAYGEFPGRGEAFVRAV